MYVCRSNEPGNAILARLMSIWRRVVPVVVVVVVVAVFRTAVCAINIQK